MHIYLQTIIVLSSTVFWFYIDTVSLFTNKRIINSGLIHGIIACISANLGYFYQPAMIYDCIFNEEFHDIYLLTLLISTGYGFYDLYIGIKSNKIDNIIHGLFFVGFSLYLHIEQNILLPYPFLIIETSSIFLNLRPLQYKIIDILFVITFFIYRFCVFPLIIGIYLLNQNNPNIVFGYVSSISLTILNIYWFYLIVNKAIKTYTVQPKLHQQ
jgi:hypothetical protein